MRRFVVALSIAASMPLFWGLAGIAGAGTVAAQSARYAQPLPARPKFFKIDQVLGRTVAVQPRADDSMPVQPISLELRGPFAERPAALAGRAPFEGRGYSLFGWNNAAVTQKWSGVRARWERERAQVEGCMASPVTCATPALRAFRDIVEDVGGLAPHEAIFRVNAAVNGAIHYQTDYQRHGVADAWSSPLQALGQSGDCEDYAIAKYFILTMLGFDESSLGIVLARDLTAGEDHAMLAVRIGSRWLLLDNRWNTVQDGAVAARYEPVAMTQGASLMLFAAPYEGKGLKLRLSKTAGAFQPSS